jgi:SAM-dependent methyltransferase
VSAYDTIADAYDEWAQVADDVAFYVDQARKVDLLVELGIGTGRVGIPMAKTGARVIGVDSSERMLGLCREQAASAGVGDRIELRFGDFREPPVSEQVSLVVAPFRSLSHLETEDDRRRSLRAAAGMLAPGGRLVFDVATPEPEQVLRAGLHQPTPDRPGMSERAEWDWENRELRLTLTQLKDGRDVVTALRLSWLSREEWRSSIEAAGLEIDACYGWFDRRPVSVGGYSVWVAHPRV